MVSYSLWAAMMVTPKMGMVVRVCAKFRMVSYVSFIIIGVCVSVLCMY